MGRELHRLTVFDGHLYAAYGDWPEGNTGPIDVVSLDLAAQSLGEPEVTLHTEETWVLREIDGVLYVPYLDPQGSLDPTVGQYATATGHGAWTVHSNVTPVPVHVFDVAVNADGLWLFGASDAGATIWRSTDDGATWTSTVVLASDGGSNPRAYCAWQPDGELIAFVLGGAPLMLRWNGTSWDDITGSLTMVPADGVALSYQDGPTLVPYFLGVSFWRASGYVSAVPATVYLRPEDETHRAAVEAALPPSGTLYLDGYTDPVSGDQYLLGGDGFLGVWRSQANGPFTHLFNINAEPVVSIAVDPVGGWLYFGTTDSRILRTPAPA